MVLDALALRLDSAPSIGGSIGGRSASGLAHAATCGDTRSSIASDGSGSGRSDEMEVLGSGCSDARSSKIVALDRRRSRLTSWSVMVWASGAHSVSA